MTEIKPSNNQLLEWYSQTLITFFIKHIDWIVEKYKYDKAGKVMLCCVFLSGNFVCNYTQAVYLKTDALFMDTCICSHYTVSYKFLQVQKILSHLLWFMFAAIHPIKILKITTGVYSKQMIQQYDKKRQT